MYSSVTSQANIVTSRARVCSETAVLLFSVSSVPWVGLKGFSHLHYSSDVDKSRTFCLQPLVSVEPGVLDKRHLKGQWVTWLPKEFKSIEMCFELK